MSTKREADGECRAATVEEIAGVWKERWSVPIITPAGQYGPSDVEGLMLAAEADHPIALVTWKVLGTSAEVVTLDAWPTGHGAGSRVLEAAEQLLRQQSVERLFLVTTNDNARALQFYVRHGYRLVRVHLDAMDRVRMEKPTVPRVGENGVPLQDLWELEKWLAPAAGRGAEPRQRVSSGSPFEGRIGFSRAVRVGHHVMVSGTAPLGDDGCTVGLGDLYLQTQRCIEIAQLALAQAGARLADVVRTRILLADMQRWEEAARAHQEAFSAVLPASTFVQVVGFINPEWLVELEVEAIVPPH